MTTTQREDRKDEVQRRRRKRDSGELTGTRLGVIKSTLDEEKFVYRWINDSTARLYSKTKEDDWNLVMNKGVKDDSKDLGNAVSEVVGLTPDSKPLRAYLCRKPRAFYEEDQKRKSKALDEQLSELRRGNDRSGGSQSDYIPNTGIKL